MGLRARAKALERFSLQQCNAAYLAVFQRLATEARVRRARYGLGAELTAAELRAPAQIGVIHGLETGDE
jgi:hypothetical protein